MEYFVLAQTQKGYDQDKVCIFTWSLDKPWFYHARYLLNVYNYTITNCLRSMSNKVIICVLCIFFG